MRDDGRPDADLPQVEFQGYGFTNFLFTTQARGAGGAMRCAHAYAGGHCAEHVPVRAVRGGRVLWYTAVNRKTQRCLVVFVQPEKPLA